MGLFQKKQNKEIPRFPKLPEKPVFPEYKAQIPKPTGVKIPELRQEKPYRPMEGLDIPIRRPEMPRPVMPQELAPTLPSSIGTQPLFVKIDKYRAAVKALDEIKQRISEAENTLARLNAIKVRETNEISQWEGEIRNIREKLIAIDKNLFEA